MTVHLNSDHLRTFLAIHETGSMTAGAELIGRSQSATSLQIKQLEETVGQPLFHRHGRGVTLTVAGEKLRPVARQIVRALDVTLTELQGGGLRGKLRVGMPDDRGRSILARIISDFAALHPDVELEVKCALGSGFADALSKGALDLAVYEVGTLQPGEDVLRTDRLAWMAHTDFDTAANDPLPIAVFDRDCWWRDLALSSLKEVGRPYDIVFTSESAAGVRAAVEGGIAAGLLNMTGDMDGLHTLPDLPQRHMSHVVLNRSDGADGPICDAMCKSIRAAFSR